MERGTPEIQRKAFSSGELHCNVPLPAPAQWREGRTHQYYTQHCEYKRARHFQKEKLDSFSGL